MIRYVVVAAGLFIGSLTFAAHQAAAASVLQGIQLQQSEAMVQQVQRRSCRARHHACRDRYGRGRDYRRCMAQWGC